MAKDEKPKGKVNMQAMMEVYEKLGTPAAPHKMLASLDGATPIEITFAV